MVIPNLKYGVRRLVLWAESSGVGTDVVAEVDGDKILTVVGFLRQETDRENVNEEWRKGSCLVLGPDGKLGWVGVGWLKRLPTDPGTDHGPVWD